MTTHKKRERTQNWTLEEKILLLKLCEGKVDILENKRGDQFSVATKNATWKEIHTEFVATLGIERDVNRLKEQWQRMKAQARSEMQDFNQRLKKYGDLAKQRQPSEISEEVLKVMRFAQKQNGFPINNAESDDDTGARDWDFADINDLSPMERDAAPSYLCQTEVKQESDDTEQDKHQIEDSSESCLSSMAASNLHNLSRVEYTSKQDYVLSALANLRHNSRMSNFDSVLRAYANGGCKRKIEHLDENSCMQMIVDAKNKEHEKRLEIIEEQIKTARLHRETAEIQKQIAQQQLKQSILPPIHAKDNNNCMKVSATNAGDAVVGCRRDILKKDILYEMSFCEERIKHYQDVLMKHKQRLLDVDTRE